MFTYEVYLLLTYEVVINLLFTLLAALQFVCSIMYKNVNIKSEYIWTPVKYGYKQNKLRYFANINAFLSTVPPGGIIYFFMWEILFSKIKFKTKIESHDCRLLPIAVAMSIPRFNQPYYTLYENNPLSWPK